MSKGQRKVRCAQSFRSSQGNITEEIRLQELDGWAGFREVRQGGFRWGGVHDARTEKR